MIQFKAFFQVLYNSGHIPERILLYVIFRKRHIPEMECAFLNIKYIKFDTIFI